MTTAYHSQYWAHALTLRGATGTIEALSRSIAGARVDLNPHQVDAALFTIRSPLTKGVILADEVGLGKTIEAGIVIAQRWVEHIWMGVIVVTEKYSRRIDDIRKTVAHTKFLSLELLLGPLHKLDLLGIGWVIVIGESGPGARPMLEEWVIDIRDQGHKVWAPFFFKQWVGVNKKIAGRILEGRKCDEMPVAWAESGV